MILQWIIISSSLTCTSWKSIVHGIKYGIAYLCLTANTALSAGDSMEQVSVWADLEAFPGEEVCMNYSQYIYVYKDFVELQVSFNYAFKSIYIYQNVLVHKVLLTKLGTFALIG